MAKETLPGDRLEPAGAIADDVSDAPAALLDGKPGEQTKGGGDVEAAAANALATGWCLRFLSGAVKGRTIALRPGMNVLGSAPECEVMLPGGDVLPRHLVFSVGELVVTLQRLGTASSRLNGAPMLAPRRSVVAGDIVSIGQIDFQLDRSYAPDPREDRMFAPPQRGTQQSDSGALGESAPAGRLGFWVAGVLVLAAVLGIAVVLAGAGRWSIGDGSRSVNLSAVEKALAPFPEVEVLATGGGQFSVKGYVESRERRQKLEQAMAPFGRNVSVHAHTAEDMVEQARRYVGDPGVAVTYTGQGRLVLSGTVEDSAVRQKIRRLSEDLHPSVLVYDKVSYREKPKPENKDDDLRARWEGWQSVLPSRMVSITEDADGLRHIQLSNGSRYYEGSVLQSGAELKRIDADGLVLSGGVPSKKTPR
ncbi:FHA domain-containing protein [Variovorax paradoxus]|nr:FHA domain-containing protein [Variovorax paradoxus]